jgi:protease-4
VRQFADGRVFSGAQAKELGLVDALGDEETARRKAAELAGLEADSQPVTLGKPRKQLMGLLPGSGLLRQLGQLLESEVLLAHQPLWLFRP